MDYNYGLALIGDSEKVLREMATAYIHGASMDTLWLFHRLIVHNNDLLMDMSDYDHSMTIEQVDNLIDLAATVQDNADSMLL